jgi:uncharacterized protein DUF2442
MTISAETVRFEGGKMWVGLSDGRMIGVPLAWFPRLREADDTARAAYEITAFGIHWDGLDEDISVDGLLAGKGDQTQVGGQAA